MGPEAMPYVRRVSVASPGLIVLLVDDSFSMRLPMVDGTQELAKSELVERSIRSMIRVFMERCHTQSSSGETLFHARYYVDLITYGSEPHPFTSEPVPVAVLDNKLRLENGDAYARGGVGLLGQQRGTDTALAFSCALERISRALEGQFANSFPPMLFHLTDAQSETDAEAAATKIQQLRTVDGAVLVVNALIETPTQLKYSGHEDFPGYAIESEAGDRNAQRLFRMSSQMPFSLNTYLRIGPFPQIRQTARLFFDVNSAEMLGHVIQVTGSIGVTQVLTPSTPPTIRQ